MRNEPQCRINNCPSYLHDRPGRLQRRTARYYRRRRRWGRQSKRQSRSDHDVQARRHLTNISVLSATVGITGITLNPSTGSAVALTLTPTVYPVDLMRLQSDTSFLGLLSLPAGTYSSASLHFPRQSLTVFNQSGTTLNRTCSERHYLPNCSDGRIVTSHFGSVSPYTHRQPATGISLNLNLQNAHHSYLWHIGSKL